MSHALLSLGQRDRSAPELGHTVVPGAESRIKLRLRLFQLFFRLFDQGMRHSGCLNFGPKASVNGPLISIKHRGEIVAHCRPLAIVRLVAVRTRHAGPAADHLMLRVPWLVRVVFANPASVSAAGAIEHAANIGMARTSRQSSAKRFVHRCATIIGTRRFREGRLTRVCSRLIKLTSPIFSMSSPAQKRPRVSHETTVSVAPRYRIG